MNTMTKPRPHHISALYPLPFIPRQRAETLTDVSIRAYATVLAALGRTA